MLYLRSFQLLCAISNRWEDARGDSDNGTAQLPGTELLLPRYVPADTTEILPAVWHHHNYTEGLKDS